MSDKNKIQIAVTIVLGVVLIALAVGKFSLPSPQELTPTAAARIALQPNANEPDLSGPLYLVLHQATKDLAFSRDPFNPLPVVPVDGPVKINLMGIVWDPQKPTAIINNEIVAEEIVRTLVASIGLILAVPITTFIASYLFKND